MKYIIAICVLAAAAYQIASQSCHLREVDLCIATMIFHYQGSGIPTDESGVSQLCESIDETSQCLRNFTNKCMTPVQREVLNLVAEGSEATVKDFCTQGSELRAKYLRHSRCLGEVHAEDQMRDCMVDMQVTVETVTTTKFDKRVGTLCCGFRRFLECGEKLTEQKCGREAVEMGRTVSQLAVTELPGVVCNSFDPNSNQCQALLPPKGSTPKGTQSSSQLARLLATALGN
uniref:Secreted protein n=1 Tax=Parasteatoda tepidariorum TaxID=114398 RepID=A0A2L2YUC2_PARTP